MAVFLLSTIALITLFYLDLRPKRSNPPLFYFCLSLTGLSYLLLVLIAVGLPILSPLTFFLGGR